MVIPVIQMVNALVNQAIMGQNIMVQNVRVNYIHTNTIRNTVPSQIVSQLECNPLQKLEISIESSQK